MPLYEKQRQKGLCPITGNVIRWEARYNGDVLQWWCGCQNMLKLDSETDSKGKKGILL